MRTQKVSASSHSCEFGVEHVTYCCPVCGKDRGKATFRQSRDGDWRWFYHCFVCGRSSSYLADLAAALGRPGLDLARVGPRNAGLQGRSGRSDGLEPLPTASHLDNWVTRLWRLENRGLEYLYRRGVRDRVIREAQIGLNLRDELVFPMYRDGELVAFKRRKPCDGAQMLAPRGYGREWPLYPEPDCERPWVLIVAGEFDALTALSIGLPATSGTLGAGTWRDEWTEDLRDTDVIVCFDNNERRQAREVVKRLKAAGISARRLDLARDLGFTEPKGDLNDYLLAGGTKGAILRAIKRGRKVAR